MNQPYDPYNQGQPGQPGQQGQPDQYPGYGSGQSGPQPGSYPTPSGGYGPPSGGYSQNYGQNSGGYNQPSGGYNPLSGGYGQPTGYGSPPSRKRPPILWALIGVAVVAVVAAVVAAVVLTTGSDSSKPVAKPRASVDAAHSATDCTRPVSTGTPQPGPLQVNALTMTPPPGWATRGDDHQTNGINSVMAWKEVVADNWIAQVGIGESNLSPALDLAQSAQLFLKCVTQGDGYADRTSDLRNGQDSTLTISGVDAGRYDADDYVTPKPSDDVEGDHIIAIILDTNPRTYFLGAYPIDDSTYKAQVEEAIKSLTIGGNE